VLVAFVGRAPDDGQSVARPVERYLAALDVPPGVGRVAEAVGISAGIGEFGRIRRHDVDLADLDLRRSGSEPGLCKVRAGRVHAAVLVHGYPVDRHRGRCGGPQDCRCRTYDTQKNLIHRL
jgi:hypothetical protein